MSTLSELQYLIHHQTTDPGARVRNLVGTVPQAIPGALATQESTWLVVRSPATELVTLDAFYTGLVKGEHTVETVAARDGILVVPPADATALTLVRGLLQLTGPTTLPVQLAVSGGPGTYTAWVNGQLVQRRSGDASFTLQLEPGESLVEFLVLAAGLAVAIPSTVRVTALGDRLDAPHWASLRASYRDPKSGAPANLLEWYTDPRAGGWVVLRREFTDVAPITSIGDPDLSERYVVVVGATSDNVTGDWTQVLPPGSDVFAGYDPLGRVVSTLADGVSSTTRVTVQHTNELVRTDWDGRLLRLGGLKELARVGRSSAAATFGYTDADVVAGVIYQYALEAVGLFDPAYRSPRSSLELLQAGDTTPPGPITMVAGFPKVVNGRVTAHFTTPEDDDYAGVRVGYINTLLGETPVTGTATGGSATTLVDGNGAFTPDLIGRTLWLVSGTGAAQQRLVTGVPDSQTLTVDTWFIAPDATTQYQVYTLDLVLTDFGVPSSRDQLSFEAVGYGTYLFQSFDHAGNLEPYSTAVVFDYDPSDDVLLGANQLPVVGIRQLRPTEQAAYPAPYNIPLNYAIVELTARDPVDETVGVGIEYRRRSATTGTSTGGNSPTSLNDTTATWTPGEHRHYLAQITGGTGEGQYNLVVDNTGNQLVFSTPWGVTPDATSTYELSWISDLPADTTGTGLDDLAGTRSRFIAVSKTDTANWITVRAFDQDGQYSEPVSYTPDFDNTPEVSSCELRLDTVLDLVRVVGAVDDDTRSFEWWLEGAEGDEPDAFTPNQDFADTTTSKAFPIELQGEVDDIPFEFSLTDGTKKTLVIRCWSQPGFTGAAGPLFKKELARSPRTVAIFENKDSRNNTSATTVRVTFRCTPAIPVVSAASAITALDPAGFTLTDSTQAWTPGQFQPVADDYVKYYVRVLNPDTDTEQFVQVLDNTATSLTLASWFDTLLGLPATGWVFEVWAGATFYRAGPLAGVGAFRGVSQPVYVERLEKDQSYLEYYSVLSGVPAEAVHTAVLDADTLPSFKDLLLTENAFEVTVAPQSPDDDTKRWVSYAAKGQPPTRPGVAIPTGATTVDVGLLNPDWERFDSDFDRESDYTFHAGVGVWYVAACPINGVGQVGPCLLRSITVEGPPPGDTGGEDGGTIPSGVVVGTTAYLVKQDPQLTSFSVRMFDENMGSGSGTYNEPAYNLLTWSHNDVLASPSTDYQLRVFYYRQDRGVGTERELTVETRYPWQDATSGDPPVGLYATPRSGDTDQSGSLLGSTYDRSGSYLHRSGLRGDAAHGDPQYRWVYRAQLVRVNPGPSTLVASYGPITSLASYHKEPIPTFDPAQPPTVAVANSGAPSLTPNNKGWRDPSPSLTLQTTWHILPDTENSSRYSYYLEVSEQAVPTTWRYVAEPWPVATGLTGNYVSSWGRLIEDSPDYNGQLLDVHVHYWTFRVSVRRLSDGALISSVTSNTISRVVGTIPLVMDYPVF